MFEPQPTPFAQFTRPSYGVTIANAGPPEYEFPPTPLGQGQLFVDIPNGGCGGGLVVGAAASAAGSANSSTAATAATAAIFASPAFHSSQVAAVNNNNNNTSTAAHLLPHQERQLPADGHNSRPHHHQHNNPPHILKPHYQDAHGPYHRPHHTTQAQHHHHQHRRQHPQQQQQQQQQQQKRLKMEHSPPSDISQQQAAARDYKPVLEGPLVGEKTTSHAITKEYAKADRTYVAKTLALPQSYSHFRPIQGDGNCGWRAIGFAYFETLVRCGNIAHVQAELARLQNLNTYIENVGRISPFIFEDMISETFDLFEEVIVAMSSGQDGMGPLMAKFNHISSSQCIIYHLRFLAASWLRGNSAEFLPYLPVDIENYTENNIENYINGTVLPVDQEIDAICVKVLVDVLLKPTNLVLEIAYLDRSEGAEVTVHRMPEETNGQNPAALGPIIYLLYRPGHYDILYRDPVLQHPPAPTVPASLQVNRVTSFTHQQETQSAISSLQDFTTTDFSALAMIPAFEPAGLSPLVPPQPASPMSAAYAPSPQSPWIPQPFPEPMQAPAPVPVQPSPPQQQPTTPMTTHPLRFSKWNFPDLPEMENAASYEPAFTTNTFKNSHFNVAHYSNNNFQPEMYRPEAEEAAAGRSGARKRSTDSAGTRKDSRG
ncbi:hypothetical protein DL766_003669 [Monosporascus sp. MC13-8B]|nr:hypothetical protein DL766_003669 [Monosporascus sp. MC13-8B]